MPWVMAEAARFRVPFEHVEIIEGDEDKRRELEARRRRVIENYEDGVVTDKTERDAKLLKIGEEMERLDAAEQVIALPPAIDWSWPPKEINAVLRALWHHVELGPDMRPVRAEWRVPEWRR
jgi:hypothetical protein